jgi:aquaporin Z
LQRLAIGFAVLAAVAAVGGIAGGAFNPAVGLVGGVIALLGWPALLIFLVAELVAAVAAGFAFRALKSGDGSGPRKS